MLKFKLIVPTKEYEKKAVEYIDEFINNNSDINGDGGLALYIKNKSYIEWLSYLEDNKIKEKVEPNNVPRTTYFFIREEDDKIIGMVNIRHYLNDEYFEHIGHIGYSIRPTERRKGYNKINLFLALEKCDELDLDKVLLAANDDNIGSIKTILSLSGVLENSIIDPIEKVPMGRYWIYVKKAIKEFKFNN